ncbi:hypothetical protein CANINC_003543 [Pichia inconspicua]|uniref:Rad60/SUMO-like domain-containing protein n=1 Tax=Pichia inconspicua TaxID=52247 RepID=A0A4T0WYI4_9ASCO|nr:hypothetical protein CANINC_003543 [[Candida] inconspicua]
MDPLDDFFAFHDDETIVKPERKKKKKKRPKTASPNVSSSSKFDKSDASLIHESPTISSAEKSVSIEPVIKETKKNLPSAESMLAGLLGLSEPSEVKPVSTPPKRIVDNVDTEELTVVDDTREDDEFLKEMNSYINSAAQQDQLAIELLKAKQGEKYLIDGVELEGKSVKFEFHVVIEAAGQISGAYDLQVKGSTKVSKLIHTLMNLFNQTANPQYPESDYNSLVFYVKSLNVILRPELRIMSLLSYKNLLEKSVTVTGYEVDAMITTEEYATVLLNTRDAFKSRSEENDATADDDSIVVTVEDAHSHESHDLEVMLSMKLIEVIEMYRYRVKLPTNLCVTVTSEGQSLDDKETLKTLGVVKGQTLFVGYDVDQLKQLKEGGTTGDVDGEDADDFVELETRRLEQESKENGEKYFTVYMAGKDKKRYKVDVKPSTLISDLATFYIQKAELAPGMKIILRFDDEDLDMNSTVADTELEEDYMIDVLY